MKLKKTYLFCAGVVLAAAAYAAPPYSYNVTYYSDDTYTTVVGRGEFTCQGRWYTTWGVQSDYEVESNHQACRYAEYDQLPP